MKPTENDKRGTQILAIQNILIDYFMDRLTHDKIDEIMKKIKDEIKSGPCAWAFK